MFRHNAILNQEKIIRGVIFSNFMRTMRKQSVNLVDFNKTRFHQTARSSETTKWKNGGL